MSLDWSISNCEKWEELNSEEQWPITNSLIWATMPLGMSCINEKNYEEFYVRIAVYEKIRGPYMHKITDGGREKYYITLEDVRRRIGLYTNASKHTLNKMMSNIGKNIEHEVRYAMRDQKKKSKVA